MKKSILNLLTTAFIMSLVVFMSCNKNSDDDTPEPTPQEDQFNVLQGTWDITNITVDGNTVSSDDWDVTITFGGSATSISYAVAGTQPDGTEQVWPGSGTMTYADATTTTEFARNDGVAMTINATDTQITISFTVSEGSGREEVVFGSWVFSGSKQ